MTITTLSSREFNQDTGRAKKATMDGPVIITDRGKPAHVLLSFSDYQRLKGGRRTLPIHLPCRATMTLSSIRRASS